jgi:hypothetical protein
MQDCNNSNDEENRWYSPILVVERLRFPSLQIDIWRPHKNDKRKERERERDLHKRYDKLSVWKNMNGRKIERLDWGMECISWLWLD